MGVYIPNMDKPKECVECFYGLRCKVVPRWLTADFTISSDCPLIEVDDDTIRKLRESAVVINTIYKRLKEVIRNSPELKKELAGKNPNLIIIDEANAIQDVESVGK